MDFMTLLGDSVSKEVIEQLEEGLATTIKNAVTEKEIELTEKADAYAEYITEQLTEKANAYGEYVQAELNEKAQSDIEALEEKFAIKESEYVSRIEDIKEAAESWGEMIREDIIEKADTYTEKFVSEYKAKNEEMFEAINKDNTAKDIVESITATLMGFGMDLDQNTAINELKESIAQKDAEIAELNGKLYEDDVSKQKEIILDNMTKNLSLSEKQKVIDAASDILTESVSGFENVVRILVSKYNSNDEHVDNTKQKINERVNTNNNKQSVSFKDTFTNGQTVTQIAKTLI